ncbi:MAG: hypothetical protein WBC90_03835 [Albidovulum sp.]
MAYVPTILKTTLAATVVIVMASSAGFANSSGTRANSVVHIPGAALAFDWHAKKTTASSTNTLQRATLVSTSGTTSTKSKRFFGKGSYICSPAGFGKKSRCFAR